MARNLGIPQQPYAVHFRVLELDDVRAAANVLYRDLFHDGVSSRELHWWRQEACPFPHLRFCDEIVHLQQRIEEAFGISDDRCEPQLIFHIPEPPGYQVPQAHVDQPPPWGHGRRYSVIIGVPFCTWSPNNGSLRILHNGSVADMIMTIGEVVALRPDVPHAAGLNTSGSIRTGVYFRWLGQA